MSELPAGWRIHTRYDYSFLDVHKVYVVQTWGPMEVRSKWYRKPVTVMGWIDKHSSDYSSDAQQWALDTIAAIEAERNCTCLDGQ